MDVSTIASAAMMVKTSQAQQTLGAAIIKQATQQQAMIANMLMQNTQLPQQSAGVSGFSFSTYA